MKLKGKVIGVETQGDTLRVDIQANGVSDAYWRPLSKMSLVVASNKKQQRSFYVGRRITLDFSVAKSN
jgi:hypothetical protein